MYSTYSLIYIIQVYENQRNIGLNNSNLEKKFMIISLQMQFPIKKTKNIVKKMLLWLENNVQIKITRKSKNA